MSGADSDDRSSDGVRSGYGDAEQGDADDGQRSGGFRAEAAHRLEFGDALAHGLDDTPSPGQRAESDGGMRYQDYWERDVKAIEKPTLVERSGDNAHGLLGVVGAVCEAE